ncbi:MAG: sugar phosphate isomerase/epimerase [Planctomycetes bacterium]|nr:sugar phosphate isomerase/epimerase [Planctomycetota bacterium]
MKLGIVTYLIGKDWNLDAIIKNLSDVGIQGVELRTTHAHGVEVTLSAEERKAVRKKFEASKVEIAGLGSAFDYHSPDPAALKKSIEGTKEYIELAADVGAPGVKVRPNGLPSGIPVEKTVAQIGRALTEVGEFAKTRGVEIRVEVHGGGTSRIPVFHQIMQATESENVYACWNSNNSDMADMPLAQAYALLRDRIRLVHMRDLYLEDYPFRELLRMLAADGYGGYCLAEIGGSSDPLRVLRYYKALFEAYRFA